MEATAADIYLKYRFGDRVVGKNQIRNTRLSIDLTVATTNEPEPPCSLSFLGWPHGAIKNGADSLYATRPGGAIWLFGTLFWSSFILEGRAR